MPSRRQLWLLILLFVHLVIGIIYLQPVKQRTLTEVPPVRTLNDCIFSISSHHLVNSTLSSNNVTLNVEHLCGGTERPALLILVCSAPSHFLRRLAIRQTWGSPSPGVKLAFLLGTTPDLEVQRKLEREYHQFGDLIQEDFRDSYRNLTLKSIMLLRWVATWCPQAHYVLKADDDVYVRVGNLLRALRRAPHDAMYGRLFRDARPDRNPAAKWHVPKEQFAGDRFPDYLSGTAYAMAGSVPARLLAVASSVPQVDMEDVFVTGVCASQAGIRRVNLPGFVHYRRPVTGCAFRDTITGHHVRPEDMRLIWAQLKKPLSCRRKKAS